MPEPAPGVKTQSTPIWKLLSRKTPTGPVLRVADPTEVVPDQFGGVEHNPPVGPALSPLRGLKSTQRGPAVQLINLPSRLLEVNTARERVAGRRGGHDKGPRRIGWCRYAP